MTSSLESHQPKERLAMVMFQETVQSLKRFIGKSSLGEYARLMVLRMVITFIIHHASGADDMLRCSREYRLRNRSSRTGDPFSGPRPLADTVLDSFGGCGTTGVAADELRRLSILIELNPEYADVRIQDQPRKSKKNAEIKTFR